ncbi:hypothetical protein [Staphylococcus phage phiSa2wa-st5.3]|uniref:ORF172 n=2 Tax=Triavirus TaxID=1623273 RepID=Q4ZD16_9CAUD|nr:ORF172 [Staphylococcus phage 42E]AAX91261.1 ORF159 [Staphylococcus phage 47]EFG40925.1 conserved hypothetical protein [Staphylococcus aureus A9754]EFG43612.1 conserved hypothetical protein [Staphylococcus aureus A8819]EFH35810.1 conserved hypothetical protein [Staphylococcus aureus A8796]UXL90979.1 hypothetical protein [Staphylococcus phage phiSa2wa-st5.3]UXL91051.1 hypothetical protein [Staphylococcus phage phiSa2wa-st5.4]UXR29023.1 hypothetical protein [Staphylococcus phage phiSa2wa-st1
MHSELQKQKKIQVHYPAKPQKVNVTAKAKSAVISAE